MLTTALEEARGVLATIVGLRGERQRQAEEVARAVLHTCNDTQAYIWNLRDDPRSRDRERERHLSRAWTEAGVMFGRLGDRARDLQERFLLKANFWSDPKRWSQAEIEKANISLSAVEQDAKKVLKIG
jgi:hypothetical protein